MPEERLERLHVLEGGRHTIKGCLLNRNWALNDEHKTTMTTCKRPALKETWK